MPPRNAFYRHLANERFKAGDNSIHDADSTNIRLTLACSLIGKHCKRSALGMGECLIKRRDGRSSRQQRTVLGEHSP